jgi:hypothetical protein
MRAQLVCAARLRVMHRHLARPSARRRRGGGRGGGLRRGGPAGGGGGADSAAGGPGAGGPPAVSRRRPPAPGPRAAPHRARAASGVNEGAAQRARFPAETDVHAAANRPQASPSHKPTGPPDSAHPIRAPMRLVRCPAFRPRRTPLAGLHVVRVCMAAVPSGGSESSEASESSESSESARHSCPAPRPPRPPFRVGARTVGR